MYLLDYLFYLKKNVDLKIISCIVYSETDKRLCIRKLLTKVNVQLQRENCTFKYI